MYFCKLCNQLDLQGISGHHVRCNPVVDKIVDVVVNNMVVNRAKDRHKKTEDRKIYQREWMRRKRGQSKDLR